MKENRPALDVTNYDRPIKENHHLIDFPRKESPHAADQPLQFWMQIRDEQATYSLDFCIRQERTTN
jgi:hypothetical protein